MILLGGITSKWFPEKAKYVEFLNIFEYFSSIVNFEAK